MAQATSGEKQITIDGEKYIVRTQVVYQDGLGAQGTLSTTSPIRYVVQYKPGPSLQNPIPDWINLGERDVTSQTNWVFTNAAGQSFQRELVRNGPNSLTISLDDATENALSKSSGLTKQQSRSILQTAPNAAPLVVGPTNPAADPTIPTDDTNRDPAIDPSVDNPTEIKSSTITIGESSGRKDFGSYAYPYDLRTNTQDRIIFTLKEIKGSTITPTFERGKKVIQRNELGEIKGQVTLPIQSGISDSNSVDWSGSPLNAIQAYAAGASLTFMGSEDAGELGNNVSNILGKIAQKIKGNTDYGNALKLYLAQEAVGINGLLSRASGAILNPNLELLFNGPQLRPFNFTFRLSPREEKEATEVRSIIRFFKEAMSVRTSSDNIFLKSPLVFDIKYITYSDDGKPLENHPSIGRIKTCALLSCDVDYTPDGSYMTFSDGSRTMTSYGLSLRFSELDPIYNTDYYDTENKSNNIPTDNIGF